jgi:hypothetical protein
MRHKILRILLFVGLAWIILMILSVTLQLSLPVPSEPYAVGQTTLHWIDTSRPEKLTENLDDFREVVALIWYPDEKGSRTGSSYFPDLSAVSNSLIESGEVATWEVYGLRFIRSHNGLDAKPAKSPKPYPIVIFSPGNGTNAEFYTVVASKLASHGYMVVALNHPYDVAAVQLSDHKVAQFYKDQESMDLSTKLLLQTAFRYERTTCFSPSMSWKY